MKNIENNIEPGHCVVCGDEDQRQLCRACRLTYRNPDGTLPEWLRDMQNEQKARAAKETRNRERISRGPIPKKPSGPGRPQSFGVSMVSFDQLNATGDFL